MEHKHRIEAVADEAARRRSMTPVKRMLSELYRQLDDALADAGAERLQSHVYRLQIEIMRAKLIDRCDGDIMGGVL